MGFFNIISKKSWFSIIDGVVCCCQIVEVSICLSNSGVENGLFKGVTGVPSNSGSQTWSKAGSVCVVVSEIFPVSIGFVYYWVPLTKSDFLLFFQWSSVKLLSSIFLFFCKC